MANAYPFTLKRKNGVDEDTLYPKTTWSQIEDTPTSFNPAYHEHDFSQITNAPAESVQKWLVKSVPKSTSTNMYPILRIYKDEINESGFLRVLIKQGVDDTNPAPINRYIYDIMLYDHGGTNYSSAKHSGAVACRVLASENVNFDFKYEYNDTYTTIYIAVPYSSVYTHEIFAQYIGECHIDQITDGSARSTAFGYTVNSYPLLRDADISSWAKSASKPTYTAAEVGARADTWVPSWSQVTSKPSNIISQVSCSSVTMTIEVN